MLTAHKKPIKRIASALVAACVAAGPAFLGGVPVQAADSYSTFEDIGGDAMWHYNGILFGDWTAKQADIEGAIAVQNNVYLTPIAGQSFSIAANGDTLIMGDYDPTTAGYPTALFGTAADQDFVVGDEGTGVIVYGDTVLRESTGGVFDSQWGKFDRHSGSTSYVSDAVVDSFFASAAAYTNTLTQKFDAAATAAPLPAGVFGDWQTHATIGPAANYHSDGLSAELGKNVAVIPISGADVEWIEMSLDASFEDYDLIVFYLPEATTVTFNQGYTQNVGGESIFFPTATQSEGSPGQIASNVKWAQRLITVMPNATTINMSGAGILGSIIAPNAYVDAKGGALNGMLIADSLYQQGGFELHAYWISPLIFDLVEKPDPGPGPEPEPDPGVAQFTKVSAETNQPLAGAVFELRMKQDGQLTTIQNGIASGTGGAVTIDNLQAGEYSLVETKAPDGYELRAEPIYFTMVEEDGAVVQQTNGASPAIPNEPEKEPDPGPGPEPEPEGEFNVVKRDAETGLPVGGAVFDVYREVFEPDNGSTGDSEDGYDTDGESNSGLDSETGGEEPDALAAQPVSAREEPLFRTLSAETSEPAAEPASESAEPQAEDPVPEEEIPAEPEEPEAEVTDAGAEDTNEPAGETDETEDSGDPEYEPAEPGANDTEIPGEGAEDTEEQPAPASGAFADAAPAAEPDSDWYDLEHDGRYWELMAENLVSDTETGLVYTSDSLAAGDTLLFVETAVPEGYLMPEESSRYTVAAYNGEEQLVIVIENTAEIEPGGGDPGVALFWKVDAATSDGIPDAQFRLEMQDGDTGEWAVLRDDILSDSEGAIEIGGLLPGYYRLIEEIAPDGYELDDTPKYFTMYESGDETLQMDPEDNKITNQPEEPDEPEPEPKPVFGQIRITKCDFDDNDIMLPGTTFTLENYTGETGKSDAEPAAMPLAAGDDSPAFLYDEENWAPYPDAASHTHVTDNSGEIIVTGLVAGVYRVEEIVPPDGYDLWGDGIDVIHFVMVETTDIYGNPVLVVDTVYNNHLEVDDEVAFADRLTPSVEEPDPSTSGESITSTTTTTTSSEPEDPGPAAESESSTTTSTTTSAGSSSNSSAGSGGAAAGAGASRASTSSAAGAAGGTTAARGATRAAKGGNAGATGAGGAAPSAGYGAKGGTAAQTGDAGALGAIAPAAIAAAASLGGLGIYRRRRNK